MILNVIRLSPQLRQEHRRVLLRYLTDELTFSHDDWVVLVEAVTFAIDSIALTALGYDQWKQRVLQIQSTRGE